MKENFLRNRMRDMVVGLVVEFFLGISLATFIAYNPHGAQTALRTATLDIHEIFGTLLTIVAIVVLIFAFMRRNEGRATTSIFGFIFVLVAFVGGHLTEVNGGTKYGVFLMATGLMLAIVSYLIGYFKSST